MDNSSNDHLLFKTRELSFLQKLSQVYWANPKSWLLDSLEVNNDKITIKRKNGQTNKIIVGEYSTTFLLDKYDRREFKITTNDGTKIRFKEIPGMLEEFEWESIVEILEATESNLSKIIHKVSEVIEELED
jgi:hypothetical protein